MESIAVCGAKCDHGSECLLLPGHGDRHETQHGCIFYDAPAAPKPETSEGRP